MVPKQIKIILSKSLPTLLKTAISAGSGAIDLVKYNFINDVGIISSIGKDIKTKADMASHEFLYEELSKTGIPVFSEESKNHTFDINKLQWIIDPIDGTLNYHRGFPMAATSIALWENGAPILGVVHHLFDDHVFFSYKEYGAWLNNKQISVSEIKEIPEAILVTGFPSGSRYDSGTLNQFIKDVQNYKKLRMLGSAALMLSYVARGIFDVYSEKDIYIWDIAAGLAIVSEAGGSYLIKPGTSMFKYNVKASNKHLC